MRVWVDLANSPQVLFFRPIITELQRRGHEVAITSRHYAQTAPLADRYGLKHTTIGRHRNGRWANMVEGALLRAVGLVRWARRQPPFDLAVSHNAYGQALAAAFLRIPFVTAMDYEHQPFNHVCFRLARRVIVPEPFPTSALVRFGAGAKAAVYPGIKEQMYLSDFVPVSDFRQSLGFTEENVLVVMRPPAPWTAYHPPETSLFDEVLAKVADRRSTSVVFLPRVPSQAQAVRAAGFRNVTVPEGPLDGPNLLHSADLVISGGGTMNREAAVLGTPAYTVFRGQLGAVDRYLIERGRMVQVARPEDVARIRVEKRDGSFHLMASLDLVTRVTDLILHAL